MPLELRPKQVNDLSYYIKNNRWMNLSDPGVGKHQASVCTLSTFGNIDSVSLTGQCLSLYYVRIKERFITSQI